MSHSTELLLTTIVVALCLGILAQVVAQRFKLPAILPLLLLGMGAGPFGLGFFDPGALGHGLEVFVHLGVAVILFEGGLSLDPQQLRRVRGPLRSLLTVGTLVTGGGSAWLARALLDVSWGTAALFGAIVTVTGPTVIAPLLRHMVVPRRVRTILISEGLMIDPLGAVLAYFVLQWIERAGMDFRTLATELLTLGLTGAVLGFVAGSTAVFVVRYRHLHDELRNLVILAVLLGSFELAEKQAPQSGILAAVVMGLVVSMANIPDLNPLKAFKGQLTTLLISLLFILLSGQLDLEAMFRLGTDGLWVAAGLIFLVRPLSVLAAVPFGALTGKEKTVLALNAPRGIVAAAVASVSAIQLRAQGAVEDAAVLEGLVYLVILVTCAWATLMAPLLPRWLGYWDDPSRRRILLIGASSLSVALARAFRADGWNTVVIDAAARKLGTLRTEGLATVVGDARDAAIYEEAEIERDTHVLALTTNDELNLLIAELVREEFGVEHPVVALQQPSSEFGTERRAWVDLLTGDGLDLPRWIRRLDDGKASIERVRLAGDEERKALRALLREVPDGVLPVCGIKGAQPAFRLEDELLDELDEMILLVFGEARERLAELHAAAREPGPAGPDLENLGESA